MSASWANPVVKRLAEGDDIEGEYDGMLVVCSWPMPIAVQKQYEAFRKELEAVLPSQAYVYPASTLHCTVCTLRAFTAGKLTGDAITEAHKRWQVVLEAARASPDWPAGAFKLLMRAPSLEGAAGIFHYSDVDGAIEKMRTCIRAAIKEAGGLAAEGGKDRSKAKALPGSPAKDPAPHIPDIIHSTAVRWSADVPDKEKALSAFKAVADKWSPIEISVTAAAAVDESVPFMHISTSTKPWWSSEKVVSPSAAAAAPSWPRILLEAFVSIVLPFVFILVATYISGKMPGKVGSDSRLHPLAN